MPIEEVEIGRVARPALQDRRHVLRLDQPGGARGAGDRHEPAGRQEQFRRGRRRPEALSAAAQRRSQIERHQAGGVRPLRRDEPLSDQRQGAADQDRPGRQAGRRGAIAGAEGLSLDRPSAALDAWRGADLAPAASRHLLHRGSGRADLQSEERQSLCPHQRQAGVGGRGGHDCGRGGEGPCRRDPDQRLRWRHRRIAADGHQACRAAVGAGTGRDAPDAAGQRSAQPGGAGDGRPTAHRPRCRDRRACSARRSSASPPRRW